MIRRGIASLIGLIGGVLIVVGGFVAALLDLSGSAAAGSLGGSAGPVLLALLGVILGFFVLLTSRPRLLWWPGRRTFNAILLIGLGVVTWIVTGSNLLIVLGAAIAILAGVILVVEGLVPHSLSTRRLFNRF